MHPTVFVLKSHHGNETARRIAAAAMVGGDGRRQIAILRAHSRSLCGLLPHGKQRRRCSICPIHSHSIASGIKLNAVSELDCLCFFHPEWILLFRPRRRRSLNELRRSLGSCPMDK